MRVTTAFNRLVRLDGVNVTGVEFTDTAVRVTVGLKRRRLECPECGWSTRCGVILPGGVATRDPGPAPAIVVSNPRGPYRRSPVRRPGSEFTADFESLVAWLATRTDKTAITNPVRVTWRTEEPRGRQR